MVDDRPKTWKVVTAAILDFLLVFFVGGYLIALLTGGVTNGGFRLTGIPALMLFALIVLYFWGMKRLGGTLFKRLFGLVGKLD
ncbi:MAG: hypothetical protein J0L76_02480 [Rhodobacterales bacterium]|nr:hypothetical protein [Rhodobacterales bacterium]